MCMEKTPWQKAVEFHGHVCPGLLVGFRAAEEALRRMEVSRAQDEELVAIVENDACGVDAVQVLTGCTFGKGNLLFRDWGKQVFTFVRRQDGRGIRVAVKPGAMQTAEKKKQCLTNPAEGEETISKDHELSLYHGAQRLQELPAEELFEFRGVEIKLPARARVFPTVICGMCGEGVMEPRARIKGGEIVCPECAQEYRAPVTQLLSS